MSRLMPRTTAMSTRSILSSSSRPTPGERTGRPRHFRIPWCHFPSLCSVLVLDPSSIGKVITLYRCLLLAGPLQVLPGDQWGGFVAKGQPTLVTPSEFISQHFRSCWLCQKEDHLSYQGPLIPKDFQERLRRQGLVFVKAETWAD